MEYTTLGNTDIQISKLCVGCMSFGKAGTMHDWTLDETEKVVKHALETPIFLTALWEALTRIPRMAAGNAAPSQSAAFLFPVFRWG